MLTAITKLKNGQNPTIYSSNCSRGASCNTKRRKREYITLETENRDPHLCNSCSRKYDEETNVVIKYKNIQQIIVCDLDKKIIISATQSVKNNTQTLRFESSCVHQNQKMYCRAIFSNYSARTDKKRHFKK